MLLKATTLLLGAAAVAQGFVLPARPGASSTTGLAKQQPAARTLKPAELSHARCVRCLSVQLMHSMPCIMQASV